MKFKSLCSYVVMKTKHRSWRAACAAQSQLLQYQSVRFLIRYKKEFDHKAIFMSSRSTLGKDPPLGNSVGKLNQKYQFDSPFLPSCINIHI